MRQSTSNSNSTFPGQWHPATSTTMPSTAEPSPLLSLSPQSETVPRFYGMPPESTGGNLTTSSHRHHHHHPHQQCSVSTIASSELEHEDLHLGSMLISGAHSTGEELSANKTSSSSSSYLGPSGSTPPEMLGEMGTEPNSVSLESWVDYVMGTGLLDDDCSPPARCDVDSSRMDTARSSEEGEMQLDAPPPPRLSLPPLSPSTTATTTDPRLTLDSLQANLEWNWNQIQDQIPDMDMELTPTRPPDRREIIRKSRRTMILQQMQPEQISRVMEFLLSWNMPIDVKIVNQE
ncbi:hypothetical protein ASPCAL10215 [Aspergillus calidoustus]|uniref:Uncharacterized protein n=1 Tax=Aspergillus calidoustus TaxID=454130 RepID=A0A0U5CBX1_ASPCI|nr:hypothetical protein ASPCAL10215 [Aspergillus calidoustus]